MTDFSTEHTRPTVLYFKKKKKITSFVLLKTKKSEKWIRVLKIYFFKLVSCIIHMQLSQNAFNNFVLMFTV